MKIAVPVHDKELEVFVRVGRAPLFAIYENGHFLELRPNNHTHEHDYEEGKHDGGHGHGTGNQSGQGRHISHGRGHGQGFGAEHIHTEEEPMDSYSAEEVELHRKDLNNLSDIDTILARAVGPNMKEALELSGIHVVKIRKKDGENAEEVVKNYLATLSA